MHQINCLGVSLRGIEKKYIDSFGAEPFGKNQGGLWELKPSMKDLKGHYEIFSSLLRLNNKKKASKMKLLLISIVLLGLAFAGIAIKIWSKKDGKFAGTCASQSPFLNKEGEACSFCGKMPDEQDCKAEPQRN